MMFNYENNQIIFKLKKIINSKKRFILATFGTLIIVAVIRFPQMYNGLIATPRPGQTLYPCHTASQSITPLDNTKNLLVSAYMDRRVKGWDLRIIGIFRRDSIAPLHCVFCCNGNFDILHDNSTQAELVHHADNSFGFPFETVDVMCRIPAGCKATHVTLSIHPDGMEAQQQIFLPIANQESSGTAEEIKPQFELTVCISTLYGDYNNVLQFTQALEMYRLLGVGRVAVYNTSCGPDLDRLLHSYSQEGLVEMVPWPIEEHLKPSRQGWRYRAGEGDLHYFGQLTTLNDCIYRYMYRSRYVLLHDIDEIIVPYHQNSLKDMMDQLQRQAPKAAVFLFQTHLYPSFHFESSGKFRLPQWEGVPGTNILEHVYREDRASYDHDRYKMIVQPRMVEQTSVHAVLKNFGDTFLVPPEVGRVIHVRNQTHTGQKSKEQLHVDTRLWDFQERLIPSVDKALTRIGMLKTKALR